MGKSYRVEYKDDLAGATWQPLAGYDNNPGTGTILQALDIGAALLTKRFYRVASLPWLR